MYYASCKRSFLELFTSFIHFTDKNFDLKHFHLDMYQIDVTSPLAILKILVTI